MNHPDVTKHFSKTVTPSFDFKLFPRFSKLILQRRRDAPNDIRLDYIRRQQIHPTTIQHREHPECGLLTWSSYGYQEAALNEKCSKFAQTFRILAKDRVKSLQDQLGIAPDVTLRLVFQLRSIKCNQLIKL